MSGGLQSSGVAYDHEARLSEVLQYFVQTAVFADHAMTKRSAKSKSPLLPYATLQDAINRAASGVYNKRGAAVIMSAANDVATFRRLMPRNKSFAEGTERMTEILLELDENFPCDINYGRVSTISLEAAVKIVNSKKFNEHPSIVHQPLPISSYQT